MDNNEGRLINFIAGTIIGSAIGVIVGLLAAPKSGIETRQQIVEGIQDTQQKASKLLDELKVNSEKVIADTRKLIEEKINVLTEAVKSGKKAALETKKSLEETETKEQT